jgi:hypothetical protein
MSYILHLSDFHYNGSVEERSALRDRFASLSRYIKDRKYDINYLVCTGDFIEQKLLINSFAESFCKRNGLSCPELEDRSLAIKYCIDNKKLCPDITAPSPSPDLINRAIKLYKESDKYRGCFLDLIYASSIDIKNAYNDLLIESMKNLYDDFSELFCSFLASLGIDSQHLIICCGNHDKTWLVADKTKGREGQCSTLDTTTGRIEHEKSEAPVEDDCCYHAFDHFCLSLGLSYNHENVLHSVDGDENIEFLILNSNYGKAYRGDLCVNCITLNDIFFDVTAHKKQTVLVTHAPLRSICESFDMNYDENNKSSILSYLTEKVSFWMCGDKHANDRRSTNNKPVFMSGMFAEKDGSKSKWNCRLINYNTEPEYMGSLIVYHDGKWGDSLGLIEGIKLCKEFGNPSSIKSIIGDPAELDPATAFNSWNNAYFHSMSSIIKYVGNYKPDGEDDYVHFDDTVNLFDYLAVRFSEMLSHYDALPPNKKSSYHVLLKIIGTHGVGKSSFLYTLWATAMHKYALQSISFLPLIFDFEQYKTNKEINQAWVKFINQCKKISTDLNNVTVVCFVDGLMSSVFSEKKKEVMESIKQCFRSNDHLFFVVSVDKYSELGSLGKGVLPIDWKGNDYMCINNVEINKYEDAHPEEELLKIVRCSIDLSERKFDDPDNTAKDTADFLSKLGTAELSLSMLRTIINSEKLDEWILRREKETARKIFYLIIRNKWSIDKNDANLKKNAYLLSFGERITPNDNYSFVKLVMNKDYRDFLCSQYILDDVQNNTGRSQLLWQLSHSVAVLVRSAFCEENDDMDSMKSKLTEMVEKAKGHCSLVVVYLIGTCLKEDTRTNLLNRILSKYPLPSEVYSSNFDREIYEKIATYFFASFLMLFGSDSGIDALDIREPFFRTLQLLAYNHIYRDYYRVFMLDYYGDLSHNRLTVSEAFNAEAKDYKKFNGYDFKRYYTSLAANLQHHTAEFPDEYVVLLLSDIVYSRLRFSYEHSDVASFFAPSSERYNDQKTILETTIERIDAILNRPNRHKRNLLTLIKLNDSDVYNTYYRYLSTMRMVFADCLMEYHSHSAKDAAVVYSMVREKISPAWAVECLSDLKWQPRIGWHFSKDPENCTKEEKETILKDTQALYEKNKAEYYPESIAEHCFECMIIAEIFLPDTKESIKRFESKHKTKRNVAEYDKNTVLRILLTREIGKATIGDQPEQHLKGKEKKDYNKKVDAQMYRLIITGVLSGFTFGDNLPFLQSKVKEESETHNYTYNDTLAKDICIIQREYTRLKYKNKLILDDNRHSDFEESQGSVDTGFGKELLKVLVTDNPYPYFQEDTSHPDTDE